MSVTPTIEKTDTSVIFRFPKSSELDLKVYNPAFFESLGIMATISIVTDRGEEVSSSKNMMGGGEMDKQLTFPYNQFVYMVNRGRDPDADALPTPPTEPEEEPIQTRFFSAVSNAFSGVKSNIQMPKLPQFVTNPTSISPKEEIQSVKQMPSPPLPTLAEPESEAKPVTPFNTFAEVAESISPPSVSISSVPPPPPPTSDMKPESISPDDVSELASEPKTTEVPKYYWKVVVEREHNPERNLEKEFWGELMEEWFRDVLRLSELEKKWGVYIDGAFYTVYGRKIKIGTVIPYSEAPANTVDVFLKDAVVLENSLPAKYRV